jgi:glycine oxidase
MGRAFDVAVVGAGIVGSAIAYECAARGARVALLDRDEPGSQASGAAAGMLAPCSEAHQAGPFLDLARESLHLWPALAERIRADGGVDPELILDGLLRVALDEADAGSVREQLHWQRGAGLDAGRWIDADEARELEPALSPDVAGAAWYPGEGHVHSRHAVRALVAAARRHGAELIAGAEVVGPGGGGGVRLSDGEQVAAGQVVLSAGAWLGELARAFGSPLPVRPVHGQLVALRGAAPAPRRVLYAGPRGYVVAKRDGQVLAGATEDDRGFATATDPSVTEQLRRRAERLVPALAGATEVRTWAGLRPCGPDRLPLLGALSDSVHVAGAHFRNGVLLAPATARGMAQMLLDGTRPAGWEAFDPSRHSCTEAR